LDSTVGLAVLASVTAVALRSAAGFVDEVGLVLVMWIFSVNEWKLAKL